MKTVLFVCEGNTCRSPMAAALFNRFENPGFLALSAGIDADYGDAMCAGALEALTFAATLPNPQNPFTAHQSKPCRQEDLAKAERVVCMTPRIRDVLTAAFPDCADKLSVMEQIPDPAGGDAAHYLSCLGHMRRQVDGLYRSLCAERDGIFPMTEADLPWVLQLEGICFSPPWSKDSFLASMRSPTTHPLILQSGDRAVGYAVYTSIYETAELYNIAVTPDARSQGHGGTLLREVIRRCTQTGADTLFLEVRRSNESARALYEKHRFTYDSVLKNYYKNPTEDALTMHLRLKE